MNALARITAAMKVKGPTPTRSETITLARAHLRFADNITYH
jgi:hypothetical protein